MTEARSFLGLASYYRRFIPDFAQIAEPLYRLTDKGKTFQWTASCEVAFDELKSKLTTSPILAFPDPNFEFIVDTDACDIGIGAVLSQKHDSGERVVAYASRALSKQEKRYSTTKKELLAVIVFVAGFVLTTRHLSGFLWGPPTQDTGRCCSRCL